MENVWTQQGSNWINIKCLAAKVKDQGHCTQLHLQGLINVYMFFKVWSYLDRLIHATFPLISFHTFQKSFNNKPVLR